ncbi:protein serine/threonine phosphatase 2C [Zalerion maritima]|uniref:Protein serine/threonine phosphatase 2C n=1 Tax=Zalerion maritima TaxID=339359 RepID=A0AAD5WR81_9PEZI|nr:protein serine/threonine phosphatase 2C [Zalerion maritima]
MPHQKNRLSRSLSLSGATISRFFTSSSARTKTERSNSSNNTDSNKNGAQPSSTPPPINTPEPPAIMMAEDPPKDSSKDAVPAKSPFGTLEVPGMGTGDRRESTGSTASTGSTGYPKGRRGSHLAMMTQHQNQFQDQMLAEQEPAAVIQEQVIPEEKEKERRPSCLCTHSDSGSDPGSGSGSDAPSPAEQQQPETRNDWRTMGLHKPLRLAEAVEKLRQEEESSRKPYPGVSGRVIRTDVVRVASLSPTEDQFCHGELDAGTDLMWPYWGVFDGHSGPTTSTLLSRYLSAYVSNHLLSRWRPESPDSPEPEVVIEACRAAFAQLDEEIAVDALAAMEEYEEGKIGHAEAVCRIKPASAGSCATFLLMDPVKGKVYAAGVGDSSSVVGKKKEEKEKDEGEEDREDNSSSALSDPEWETVYITTDHTASNPREISLVNKAHPADDPSPIDAKTGRLLSCAVTRSFGDSRWKWPREKLEKWQAHFWGKSMLKGYKTPPYLSAMPDVYGCEVKEGDFVVIGSDGFWDHFEKPEEVVKGLGKWVENERSGEVKENGVAGGEGGEQGRKKKGGYPYNWLAPSDDFVFEHENAATNLMRNAFGGKNEDLFCSAMSTTPPDSKEARDDATVVVVLF